MSFFCFSLTLLRICDNIKSFGWSCSEPAPSKFRFQRSWHVSTQKSNTNLDYFTFNQSIKLKFSLYRAIWVCFTWIAHCTPHPLPTITYSHPSPPKLHPRKREWRVAFNRILGFAQRFLGSSQGKHCNSLERCLWKVVLTSKNNFGERLLLFISNGFGWCWYKESVSFCFNNYEIC